ncbi:hypothetical protein KIPB_007544, partial [Kipferlia bialata]
VTPARLDTSPRVRVEDAKHLLPKMMDPILSSHYDLRSVFYERQYVCAQLEHLSSEKEDTLVIPTPVWVDSDWVYDRCLNKHVTRYWFQDLEAFTVDNSSSIRVSGRITFEQPGMKKYWGVVEWKDDKEGRVYVSFGDEDTTNWELPELGEELGKGTLTFEPSDIPLRIQLTALSRSEDMCLESRLIPTISKKVQREREGETAEAARTREFISSILSTQDEIMLDQHLPQGVKPNRLQKAAIAKCAHASPTGLPHLIYGPPGTGKTYTVVALAALLLNRDPEARILLCAPSNTAADVLAEALFHMAPDMKSETLRICSGSYERKNAPDSIRHRIPFDHRGVSCKPHTQDILCYRCLVTTSSLATTLDPRALEGVSHVVVDECGSALEVDTLAALCSAEASIVLAGDPMQLGPVVVNEDCKKVQYGISMLQRLMIDKGMQDSYTMLTENYRNHPSILAPSNTMFYQDRLIERAGIRAHRLENNTLLPRPGFPLVFTGVLGRGYQSESKDSHSWRNDEEVRVVLKYASTLVSEGVAQTEIAVVTPYRLQGNIIRRGLRTMGMQDILVGSVEALQGQEFDAVIMSCVRTYVPGAGLVENLGFVSDGRRLNVMLTRARTFVALVGDPNALSLCPFWRGLLRYIDVHGGAQGKGLQCLRGGPRVGKAPRERRQRQRERVPKNRFAILEVEGGKVDSSSAEEKNQSVCQYDERLEALLADDDYEDINPNHTKGRKGKGKGRGRERERQEREGGSLGDLMGGGSKAKTTKTTPATSKKGGKGRHVTTPTQPPTKPSGPRYIPGMDPAPVYQTHNVHVTNRRQPVTQAAQKVCRILIH